MSQIRIPVYKPDLDGNEKRYVMECMDSTWISSKGAFISNFEQRFCDFLSRPGGSGSLQATAVSNGTVALHLALIALGIGPDDEVIVPTLTYVASANAIEYTGATPIFADSRHDTWQIDPEDVERKITSRTKAIMPVHLYGQACDMDALTAIARRHRLFVIEDCAEAIGTYYKGRAVGTFGDIATFSFFGNKTMTTGEGGMVVTADRTLIERARHFKGQGLAAHREYWHDVIGYNYRMTNICAAIGVAQLERVHGFIERKRHLAALYKEGLRGAPVTLHAEAPGTTHSYWMCTILVDNAADRDSLRRHLAADGIETRPMFYPLHTMPMYSQRYQRNPVAEELAWRGINLPSFPQLTDAQVDEICERVQGYYAKGRSLALAA